MFDNETRYNFVIKCFNKNKLQETALLAEIGLAENPLTLRALWDTQKSSTSTASNASSNIGRPMFPAASPNLTGKPCASVSFSSAPDIFVRITF